ncbi:DUF523 and DUF1722 domain-containing protein [Ectothiorhodospiraceae bacterium 2226]|nr:DUF523 and DUF1722 domain-containing protein [Ectothiorhodospiraceae bacterium 2226]
MRESPRLRLGISSCLLGEAVRFDANHKHDAYLTGTLGQFFDFVGVCPEVAIGLGVPRPPIRLVGDPDAPRAVGVRDPNLDVSGPLTAYGAETAARLPDLAGYIFKSKSPSCGVFRVKVYPEGGGPGRTGRGLYARTFMHAQPLLPVEEEGRLGDPDLRDNFLERVFTYARWCELMAEGLSAAALVRFHAHHKLSLMAHDPRAPAQLGRLVAAGPRGHGGDLAALAQAYIQLLMPTLQKPATIKRHANVLQHLAGYLKRDLDAEDRAELAELIDAYRRGEVPRAAPLALLRHHFRRHPDPYIGTQAYLYPPTRAERLLRGI